MLTNVFRFLRDAVDWEYVGKVAAAAIVIVGGVFLTIIVTISNLRIGS